MQISSIRRQVKNPERVSIFVDGKYSFSLSLQELLDTEIKTGLELSPARLKKLQKISSDGKLKAQALNWMLSRPHSERELRDYLRRKNANHKLVEQIVNDFQTRGYQDDRKYAFWLADVRARKSKSNRAIRTELFTKGVSREVVDEVLADSGDEMNRLKELVTKKRQSSRYKNDDSKLKQYLVRKGFNYDIVKECLKDLAS